MKRKRISSLALLFVLCVTLTSCDASAGDAGLSLKQDYNDSLIEEQLYEADYVEEGWEEPMHLSYELPLLQDDTPDAQAFNESLQKLQEDAEAGNILYDTVSWEHYWNGSILSLVLCLRAPYESAVEYCTCNYDFAEGRILSNREVLERAEMSPAGAEKALCQAAAQKFDSDSLSLPALYGHCFDAILELRAWTISRSNLDIDRIPLFLGNHGIAHAMVQIGTPAGGGNYFANLSLESETKECISKTVTLGNLTAELKDGQVTLCFSEIMGAGEHFLSGESIDDETPYSVLGLYGDYTDLVLGYMGDDDKLFLCLTDTNGQVSVCNLTEAVLSGGYFCIMGPLSELQQINSIQVVHDMDNHHILACLSGGEKVSIDKLVSRATETVPLSVQDSTWFTSDGIYNMNIHMNASGYTEAVWGGGGGVLSSGKLLYIGMTEDGMHFLTTQAQEGGGNTKLLLTFTVHTHEEEPEAYTTLTVKQLSGDSLSGIPKGNNGVNLLRD